MTTQLTYKFIFLAFLISEFSSSSSKEIKAEEICIDPNQVKLDAICTLEYAPVWGCDNVTYGNLCQFTNNGLLNYTDGECPNRKGYD